MNGYICVVSHLTRSHDVYMKLDTLIVDWKANTMVQWLLNVVNVPKGSI